MNKDNYRRNESLVYLVNRTSRLIRKYFNKELTRKGYSLTGEQYDVLVYLWHRGEQHQQDIAKALCKDKTTITRLIKSVETMNLVKRISNKTDKRQKVVCLTAPGKIIMKGSASLAQDVLKKVQKGLDPSNLVVCKEVLTQINKTLSQGLTKS